MAELERLLAAKEELQSEKDATQAQKDAWQAREDRKISQRQAQALALENLAPQLADLSAAFTTSLTTFSAPLASLVTTFKWVCIILLLVGIDKLYLGGSEKLMHYFAK